MEQKSDFSQGKVWKNIVSQAIPLTLAEFVHLLYNIVDRIYIGHMNVADNMALTGIGLTFPIVTLIAAFTALFGKVEHHCFLLHGVRKRKMGQRRLWAMFSPCY